MKPSISRKTFSRYGLAILTPVLALAVSLLLHPVTARVPFIFFFAAVAISANRGDLGPGILSILLSVVFVDYFILAPIGEAFPENVTILAIFVVVASVINLVFVVNHRSQAKAQQDREWLRTTLSSIGDAVIATDAQGRIAFMNAIAEQLTGWTFAGAYGKALGNVFKIISDKTRQPVDDRLHKVSLEGVTVGLANHTILIAKNGREYPINESGAPIRDASGSMIGAILVFRDISEQKRQERAVRFLDEATKLLSSSIDYELTLRNVGKLVVPYLADWCSVAFANYEKNILEPVFVEYSDPEVIKAFMELMQVYVVALDAPFPSVQALRSGKPMVIPDLAPNAADLIDDLAVRELARKLDIRSAIHIPLIAREQKFGTLTLNITGTRAPFTADDLPLVEELGRRISLAIDNARLYREAQQQRERWQVTLTSIGDALIATDQNGVVTFLNPIAQGLTGYSEVEAVGRDVQDVFPIINELSRTSVENPVAKVLREGAIVGLANHTLLLRRDGTAIPIDDSGAPIHDTRGNLVGSILVFRDMSERVLREREREELLAQVQEAASRLTRLQEVTAALSGALTVADMAGIFINIGLRAARASGGTLFLLGSDGLLELIASAGYSQELQQRYAHLSLDGTFPITDAVRRATPVWLDSRESWQSHYPTTPPSPDYRAWSYLPLFVDGKPVGAIGLSFLEPQQFTDSDKNLQLAMAAQCAQALARARLYEAEQKSRIEAEQARQRLLTLAEASAVLASTLDYESALFNLVKVIIPTFADNLLVNVLDEEGHLQVAALGASDSDAEAALRELAQRYPIDPKGLTIRVAAQSGRPNFASEVTPEAIATYAQDAEHAALMRRVGTRSYINMPLFIRDQIIGVMSIGMAQSGRRYTDHDLLLAEELGRRVAHSIDNARLYREAQQAIRLRNDFLSTAAHELRTPITSMRGFSQLLMRRMSREKTLDPQAVFRNLQQIDRHSEKLARLLTQLLDVSRLEAGRLVLERELNDLSKLANDVVEAVQRTTQQHQITLRTPENLLIAVDPLRLEQVIINLLDNAVRYSPTGGLIEVDISNHETYAQLTVTDHGLGIAPDRRSHLFERFYQAHQEGYRGGMGLGLYISRQVIELHNGQIRAEFPDEGGTRFVIQLPKTVQ